MLQTSGYTLIQAVITISIISILSLISIPSFTDILETNRLKSVTENTYSSLKLAQSEALRSRANVTIDLISGSNWCIGFSSNGSCNCSTTNSCLFTGSEQVISSNDFNDVSLALSNSSSEIIINSDNGYASPNDTLTFTLNSKTTVVTINEIGRVKICSDSVSAYKSC